MLEAAKISLTILQRSFSQKHIWEHIWKVIDYQIIINNSSSNINKKFDFNFQIIIKSTKGPSGNFRTNS